MTAEERALRIWTRFVGLKEPCNHWPGTAWIAQEIERAVQAERSRAKRARQSREGGTR